MVALKSSGIWEALGDGAGGYDDTLGNPYPPFAFNSGMWTQDVSRADCESLGLLGSTEKAKAPEFDFANLTWVQLYKPDSCIYYSDPAHAYPAPIDQPTWPDGGTIHPGGVVRPISQIGRAHV